MKVEFTFAGEPQALFESLLQLFYEQLDESRGYSDYIPHEGRAYLLESRPVVEVGTRGNIRKIHYLARSHSMGGTSHLEKALRVDEASEDEIRSVFRNERVSISGIQQSEPGITLTIKPYRPEGLPVTIQCHSELWQPQYNEILKHLGVKPAYQDELQTNDSQRDLNRFSDYLPEKPPVPGMGDYTWNDVFDWFYRTPRHLCPKVKDLEKLLQFAIRTIEVNKSLYVAEYGEMPMPDSDSKFAIRENRT